MTSETGQLTSDLRPLFRLDRVGDDRLAAGGNLDFHLEIVGGEFFGRVRGFEDRPLVLGERLDALADEGFRRARGAVRDDDLDFGDELLARVAVLILVLDLTAFEYAARAE